jgi:hypothetical protein
VFWISSVYNVLTECQGTVPDRILISCCCLLNLHHDTKQTVNSIMSSHPLLFPLSKDHTSSLTAKCIILHSPVVTICTTRLTLKNSTFWPHSVFMCSVWISEQTAIISLYNINWLICITETGCVYCAVRTGSLRTTQVTAVPTGPILPRHVHHTSLPPLRTLHNTCFFTFIEINWWHKTSAHTEKGILTLELTSKNRVLLEKLTVPHTADNYSPSCGTSTFISIITTACHVSHPEPD